MAAKTKKKDIFTRIEEELDKIKKGGMVTFENLAKEFDKAPTAAQAKKIKKMADEKDIEVVSASEYAKYLTVQEEQKREATRKRLSESELEEEFDITKEKELL